VRFSILSLALLFGIVSCSSKESTAQAAIKKYLKETMSDPDSYESVEFGELKGGPDIYTMAHSYKEKLPSGETAVQKDRFVLNKSCFHAISVRKNKNDTADLEWAIRWNNAEAK
jgi:hypothetical protein